MNVMFVNKGYLSIILVILFNCHGILSDADILEPSTFKDTMNSYSIVIVNFYADWCHFCRNLAPIYNQAADKLNDLKKSKKALLAKVDCVAQPNLAAEYGVQKYPTLKVFREGVLQKQEYRGQRSVEALVDYIKEQLKDPFTSINSTITDLTRTKVNYDGKHIVGVFRDLSADAQFIKFKKIASTLLGECKFFAGSSSDPKHIGLYTRDADEWNDANSKPHKIETTTVDMDLKWAKENCVPFVRELTFSNAEELTEEGLPLLILFYKPSDKDPKTKFAKFVNENLKSVTSVNYLTADGQVFAHPLAHLNKNIDDLPLIAIDSFQHIFTLDKPFEKILSDSSVLRSFIEDLHSGKLHREFHYGPDSSTAKSADSPPPAPKESVFKKLAPSGNRYSMPHDEF